MNGAPYQTTHSVCDLNEPCDKTCQFDCGYRQVAKKRNLSFHDRGTISRLAEYMAVGIAKYVFSITRKLCVCVCVQTVTCDNGQAPRFRQRGHRRSHRQLYSVPRLKSAPEPEGWNSKPSDALNSTHYIVQGGWMRCFVI